MPHQALKMENVALDVVFVSAETIHTMWKQELLVQEWESLDP